MARAQSPSPTSSNLSGGVDDVYPIHHADLDGRDAGAVGGVHRVGHIDDMLTDFVGHGGDWPGRLPKPRVGIPHDRSYGHVD
jgi:hypothetical protein